MTNLNFLLINFIDDYNYDMGHVYLSDQLHKHYWFEKWTRKRKWWWSTKFWVFHVILVNDYVTYISFMEIQGFNK